MDRFAPGSLTLVAKLSAVIWGEINTNVCRSPFAMMQLKYLLRVRPFLVSPQNLDRPASATEMEEILRGLMA
jgi:hypothetical protein